VSASPARRRFGRAARATGFEAAQPLSIASAKTKCRNVMTLRTVLGAAPLASIARASRSMSCRLTDSTRRLPSAGRDVDALHRLAVLAVREPRALDDKPAAEGLDSFIDGPRALKNCRRPRDAFGLDELARGPLGLGACEPVLLAARPDLADAAVQVAPVGGPPAVVVGAGLDLELA
jgi:hypothetical protein